MENNKFISPGVFTSENGDNFVNPIRLPKMLIIGHARHGKDSLAEIMRDEFGYTFQSSSQAASDIFLYAALKDKYGYQTSEECFEDRVNHRAEWKQMICDYNVDDRARLAKGILEKSDCYVGMRDWEEIDECKRQGLFDIIIWVDACERLPHEDASSFNITKDCADIIIENNTDFEAFRERVIRLGKLFLKKV
jgi:dephospho-CoA kinase